MNKHQTRTLTLLLFVLLTTVPIASVMGAYFDPMHYTPGQSPPAPPASPWTLTSSASGCLVGQTNQTGLAYDGPTVFSIAQPSATANACYAQASSLTLSIPVNNSASVISVTWWMSMLNAHGGAATKSTLPAGVATFSVYVNSTLIYSNDTATITPGTSSVAIWTKLSHGSYAGALGQQYNVTFKIATTATSSAYWFTFALNDIFINGANAILKPHNLVLLDYGSHQWFNLSGYSGSHILLNYTSAFNCGLYNMIQTSPNSCSLGTTTSPLEVPDLYVGLSGARLLTVYVGGTSAYVRTFIPPSPLPAIWYVPLDVPSVGALVSYVLTIDDLTGNYPYGTTQAYLNQGAATMTSGYVDAQGQFAMTVRPGSYQLVLRNPANPNDPYSQPLTLSTVDVAPKVIVQSSSYTVAIGPIQQYVASMGWDCDLGGITASITDTVGQSNPASTTGWITLVKENQTGLLPIWTYSYPQTPIASQPYTFTYDFRTGSNANYTSEPNPHNSTQYFVQFNMTTTAGTLPLGEYPVPFGNSQCPSNFPSPFPTSLNIPGDVLGLSQIFPQANAWETLLATFIIVMVSTVPGARFAHVGMLVDGVLIGLFYEMQWLTAYTAGPLAGLVTFIGVIGLLENRARRPLS